MADTYRITNERRQDLHRLPGIELAAAALLEGQAPASVLSETSSLAELDAANAEGRLWLALEHDVPVGFAHVECIDSQHAHLKEIDVHPDHGWRGIGARLLGAVCSWAARGGFQQITLTTFRDVPFNMPFYERFGFEPVPSGELQAPLAAIVADETSRGLDPARRVVMRFALPL